MTKIVITKVAITFSDMPDLYTLFKDCRVSPEIITKYIAYLHNVSFKSIKTFSDYRTRISVRRILVREKEKEIP